MTRPQRRLQPVLRVAPPRPVDYYVVSEYQIDQLAQGAANALSLNVALFLSGSPPRPS